MSAAIGTGHSLGWGANLVPTLGTEFRLLSTPSPKVYGLFDLTLAEIKQIAESTKYRYGEV